MVPVSIMVNDQNMEADSDASPAPDGEISSDTKRLSQAVIQLNIARRNVGMYPPGHAQVEQSVGSAHAILHDILSIRPEITLGAAKDTVLVGNDHLDRKNSVYRDFAASLNVRDIAAVTFLRGLRVEDVESFIRILTTDPEAIRARGGIDKVAAEADISNITIQKLDYSGFHLTEEDEIVRSEGGGERSDTTSIWQGFVSQLVSGAVNGSGKRRLPNSSVQINPSELAEFLNESKLDIKTVLQGYEKIVTEQVTRVSEGRQLSAEQSSTLTNLVNMVQNLEPDLRRQFLAVASRHFISERLPSGAEEVLEVFPDSMIIDMIRQASEEGRRIPQRLMEIVQRISFADDESQSDSKGEAIGPAEKSPSPELSQSHAQTPREREGHESTTAPEDDATLKALAEGAVASKKRPEATFPIDEYLQTLEDSHLNLQIAQALLAFMEQDVADVDYKEHTDKLLTLLPDLVEKREFSFLLEVLETLRSHSGEKGHAGTSTPRQGPAKARKPKGEGVRRMASSALKTLCEPGIVSKAAFTVDNSADQKGREASDFLRALGPSTIPELVDSYADNESPDQQGALFKLLVKFGQAASKEAQERLDDSRDYYVKNLLVIIEHAGTAEALPDVRPLVQHDDPDVRTEALAILLKFRDPAATTLLRKALISKDKDVSSRALCLAGRYGEGDVVEDILSMLKKRPLFKSSYETNEKIIKVLGEIGDPRAIPSLEDLARSKWALYSKSLVHMKIALFESLGGYPRKSLKALLHMGRKSENARVRKAVRKIIEAR